ncbi:MAG: PIN domain-containing protein [Candidatus Limnocylindrales bacterium]
MDDLTFVDTNVLVYAHDATESVRQPVAQRTLKALWSARTGVLSTQVLQEFYVVATAPNKLGMHPSEAREIVDLYSAWPVTLLDPIVILAASRRHERAGLSFWDSLIVEAARIAGATKILSEDMGDGQDFDGIRVENPFKDIEAIQPDR